MGDWLSWAAAGACAAAAGGMAVWNAALRSRLRRTETLFEVSVKINATLVQTELLQVIMDAAKQVMGVEAASILLLDEATGELYFELALGDKGQEVRQIRLQPGEGIAGHVAATGQAIIVNDTKGDPRWSDRVSQRTGFVTRNLLTVPVVARGRVVGVLQVLNKRRGRGFNVADQRLLERVAGPIAVALENAQLYGALEQSIQSLQSATAAKERLESELQIAGGIQLSFLPRTMPSAQEPFDVCALLKSAKEVGGDFYNFFKIDDDHLFFTLGDVSDKGIPAALFMAVTLTLLKGKMQPGLSPGELLTQVNDELCLDNAPLFATIVCGVLRISTGEAVLSDGGHCTPYIVKADGTVVPVKLKKGIPLGSFPDFPYSDQSIQLDRGDRLVVYTDGITEAENGAQEQYSAVRLESFLGQAAQYSSAEIIDALLMDVYMYADGAPQSDDIAVLCLMRR